MRLAGILSLAALVLLAAPTAAQNPASYGYNPYGGYYGPTAMYNPYTGNGMGRYDYNPYVGRYGPQPGPRFAYQNAPVGYNPYIGPTSSVTALRNPYTGTYGWGYRLH